MKLTTTQRMSSYQIFIILFFISLCLGQVIDVSKRVEFKAEISDTSEIFNFVNIAVEQQRNGHVYIGARNRLYQLDSKLQNHFPPIVTGPVEDNIVCKCNKTGQTDNINKLLLIDYQNSRVVCCGSVEQGVCEIREQGNLNHVLSNTDISALTTKQYVAASGYLSTVGITATTPQGKTYLFVGSSKTTIDEPVLKNTYDEYLFYTVSMRYLPENNLNNEMFSIYSKSSLIDDGVKMKEENFAQQHFRVQFIDGFATNITGYFVVTHPSGQGNSFKHGDHTTYISQICLDENESFNSYMELPLECQSDGDTYNKAIASRAAKVGSILENGLGLTQSRKDPTDVVMISFVKSNGEPGSAVCMFTLKEIERRFVDLTKSCMKDTGGDPSLIAWIRRREAISCGIGQFPVQSPACVNHGVWDIVQHLQDRMLSKNAVFVTRDTFVSAIEITQSKESDHTVAFFGTEDGQMLKVQLDSANMDDPENVLYETLIISPPRKAVSLETGQSSPSTVKIIRLGYGESAESQRVYALTPSIVVGLPLFNCSQYADCETCLASRDPFCGWCTLESRCTSSGDCEHSGSVESHMFIKSGGVCPRLESDDPLTLTTSDSEKQLELKAYNVPYMRNRYSCSFGPGYSQRATNVRKLNSVRGSPIELQCVSPPKSSIPDFPPGKGYVTVPLSLVYVPPSAPKRVVVSTDFSFYQCSVYTSCMACVGTEFNCVWCLAENLCTHQPRTYCPQSNVAQTTNCPQLSLLPNQGNMVYLADGKSSNVVLPVSMLPDAWSSFECELTMSGESRPLVAKGERDLKAIRCLEVTMSLPSKEMRSSEASLRIITKLKRTTVEIDNPHNIKVEIYRCALGNDGSCGSCLESPPAWGCGWCDTDDACSLRSNCLVWLEASKHKACRDPKITSFSPMSAPFGGKLTRITLRGVNFDRNANMLIEVAGVKCNVLKSNCCEAGCVATARSVVSGQIMLCINNSQFDCKPGDDYKTTTSEIFSFVDPKVFSFDPSHGLRGWGTHVIVKGEHLDTGNSVIINVDRQPCEIIKKESKRLECRLECSSDGRSKRSIASHALHTLARSKRSSSTTERRVTATFDGVHRVAKSGFFDFMDHVSIDSMEPATTIRSGGLLLTVRGQNLDLIQDPQIRITLPNDDEFIEECQINGRSLICTSPDASSSFLFQSPDRKASAYVDIESAGCSSRSVRYKDRLTYHPNPVLNIFEGEDKTKIFRDEPIYITGSNLCPEAHYCSPSKVRVMIGETMLCNITRLDMSQITCVADAAEYNSYPVTVVIGGYAQDIGFLKYEEQAQPLGLIVGIVVAVVAIVVVAVVIMVVCVYRRRAKASDEELKNVQMEMDKMESQVAKVCKEEFAELQTDMCELDMYAAGVGIPYLEYRYYLMRVLFPDPVTSHQQHRILLSRNIERNDSGNSNRNMSFRGRAGMDRFNQLLDNKIFLLSFIRAVETQQSFSMKDKAQVAGLLFIILQNRLPYATEIMEELLADLIRKNMESKNHPKLLLRRTESVAEKMLTHWFSILLHRFVIECAGEPLFTLFRAIKQKIDKGPLDAFTNEAKYSLSEDKLLRQNVDHQVITLCVMNYMADYEQPPVTVKVLSCDSVSQVKRKVLDVAFMNIPYSHRCHPEQIDLEWQRERATSLLLRDEDETSVTEGEWKKVNTLQHYDVVTNSKINLIPRREIALDSSAASFDSKSSPHLMKHNGSGSRLLPQRDGGSLPRHKQPVSSRSGTPTLYQEGPKLWHLVKSVDQDQREGMDRTNKMVSEIYLPRLLTAKGTIQKYVDDLFETIFSVVQRGHALPLAVKHMFDFLDHQAEIHGISDPDIVHAWKSNCLPLRFWVNLIKNPEFVYDVHKSPIVDCYLSVIAQAFMDSCSTAKYELGKDSPSNKLLYNKEIPEYREWVKRYYSDISNMPGLDSRDLSAFLREESTAHAQDFNTQAALSQLYAFVRKYDNEVIAVLDEHPDSRRQQLVKQVLDLTSSLNGST